LIPATQTVEGAGALAVQRASVVRGSFDPRDPQSFSFGEDVAGRAAVTTTTIIRAAQLYGTLIGVGFEPYQVDVIAKRASRVADIWEHVHADDATFDYDTAEWDFLDLDDEELEVWMDW